MWSKLTKKTKLLIGIGIPALIVIGVGIWLTFQFLIPYLQAENTMDPNGTVSVFQQEDGSFLVRWPEGENAQSHTLQVFSEKGGTSQLLYGYTTVGECTCHLPELPEDEELLLQISSAHAYGKKERPGKEKLEARLTLKAPKVEQLRYRVDPDTDIVDVTYKMGRDEQCLVYVGSYENGEKPVLELTEKKFSLSFGDNEQFPVPQYNQQEEVSLQVQRLGENYVLYGQTSGQIHLIREDFLGTVLFMEYAEKGSNSYTLTWNETKGEHYEVQSSQDKLHWNTVYSVEKDGVREYTTNHLDPFETFYFQVIALSEDGEPSAQPDEVELITAQKPVFSTIWPLMEQDVYADTNRQKVLGKAPAGTAYSVLEEKDGMFAVRFENSTGYIDSNYCMINLPDFAGELFAYNITNSYDSIYMVHEFGIDSVTGTVIAGYENVMMGEEEQPVPEEEEETEVEVEAEEEEEDEPKPYRLTGEEEFLAPLLYPAAKKLLVAGLAAKEQGYRLKMYDTFRPREATLSIYELTEKIIGELVPKAQYSGKPLADLDKMKWQMTMDVPQWVLDGYEQDEDGYYIQPETEETQPSEPVTEAGPEQTVPEETVPEETVPEETVPQETTPDSTAPTEPEMTDEQFQQLYLMRDLTYQIFMTDSGRYKLNNFLAKGMSNHNIGIAVDLTMEKLEGEDAGEVEMQTSIHDLSWFSESSRNNAPAKLLREIMTSAGLGGLGSEWWHFQDNDAKAELGLKPLQKGISPEGWVCDDEGWRYRLETGEYYENCTKTIDKKSYSFDKDGYVIE